MIAVLPRGGETVNDVENKQSVPGAGPSRRSDCSTDVGIVASNMRDAARVATLLGSSDPGAGDIFFCEPAQIPQVQAFAMIICHRVDQNVIRPILPDNANVSRIIVLSDCAREETVVQCLDDGARHFFNINDSDYLLQARLEAGLRQHRRIFLRSFVEGDIHFDVRKRKVSRAGHPVDLSPKEFEFACHLFSRLDKVVRNSELMTSVWSLPPDMDTRRIDTAACRVRKKLGLSRDQGWELKRVRRVGYRLSRVESRFELIV